MAKLFDIKANERELIFKLETYKGNRIALKIIRLLKADGIYKVRESYLGEIRIFEVRTNSDLEESEAGGKLKEEIISYIPDNFKVNYRFNFKEAPLGFVRSFCVRDSEDKIIFDVYHRIQEIRTNGASVMPSHKDQIIF